MCVGSNALKPIVQRHALNEGASAISHAHQTALPRRTICKFRSGLIAHGDLGLRYSRKSRSITSWVSISRSDGAEFMITLGCQSSSQEFPWRISELQL